MLTRDRKRFGDYGKQLNKDNKGVFIDDELNKIVNYLQKKLLVKLKKINIDTLKDGDKGQLLAVKNGLLRWSYVNNSGDLKIKANKIKVNPSIGEGFIHYNINKWYTSNPPVDGKYILTLDKNVVNFKLLDGVNINYNNAIVGNDTISSINNYFDNSLMDTINNIKLNVDVGGDKTIYNVTKALLLKYKNSNPGAIKPKFIFNKLKSGEFRDSAKLDGIIVALLIKEYEPIFLKYYNDNKNKFKNVTLDGHNQIKVVGKPKFLNTSIRVVDCTKAYWYNFKFTGQQMGHFEYKVFKDKLLNNHSLRNVQASFDMRYARHPHGLPIPEPHYFGGLESDNLKKDSLTLDDIKDSYTTDIYEGMLKYIKDHPL